MSEHETHGHVRGDEPDHRLAGMLRAGDPLTEGATLERELAAALARTRRTVADAAAAVTPIPVVAFTTYRAPNI